MKTRLEGTGSAMTGSCFESPSILDLHNFVIHCVWKYRHETLSVHSCLYRSSFKMLYFRKRYIFFHKIRTQRMIYFLYPRKIVVNQDSRYYPYDRLTLRGDNPTVF